MPGPIDFAYLAVLFVLVTVFDGLVFAPRFRAAVAAGVRDARRKAYRRTTIGQWFFSALVLVGWVVSGRSWTALGVVPAGGWRLFVAAALLLLVAVFGVRQMRAIRRIAAKPERRAEYRTRFADLAFMLPHTRVEYRWFVALSVTAGVCEELLVRGYLMWVLHPFMPVPTAMVVSALAFGVAHAYQGRKAIVKTAGIGLVMNLVVAASGWLLPAMVVHGLIDATSGALAFTVLEDNDAEVLAGAA